MAGEITFDPNSSPGERAQLSGSRIINGIAEKLGTGETIIKRAPGLVGFRESVAGNRHCRGMIQANSGTLLVAFDEYVEAVTGGVGAVLGPMPGSDLVTLARNNAVTPNIVAVSPANGAFELSASAAPAPYPDPDIGFPNSVAFVDGYFFFTYGDGTCQASGLNSTNLNTLDRAKAESHSGGLIRGVGYRGQLFLFGPSFCEVWQNTGNPTGFPFTRATVIPRGLASTNAVAGWEDHFVGALIWAGADNLVYQLQGYEPSRISTHDIERDLQNIADKTTLRAFVFMNNGHPFWCLKSPKWTWCFDLLTSTWQERESYGSSRWRAEQSVYAFGDWVLGDEATGRLFRSSNLAYDEDGDPLIWDVQSTPIAAFPSRVTISRVDFDMAVGVGPAGGAGLVDEEATVRISWSDDGGATYGRPLDRKLGKSGDFRKRVSINRCGRTTSYGRQWRLVVSDPVYVGVTSGKMHALLPSQF